MFKMILTAVVALGFSIAHADDAAPATTAPANTMEKTTKDTTETMEKHDGKKVKGHKKTKVKTETTTEPTGH